MDHLHDRYRSEYGYIQSERRDNAGAWGGVALLAAILLAGVLMYFSSGEQSGQLMTNRPAAVETTGSAQ